MQKENHEWLDRFQSGSAKEIENIMAVLLDKPVTVGGGKWQICPQDKIWDISVDKLVLTKIKISKDYQGEAYLVFPIEDAILVGGTLALYQEQRILQMMKNLEINDNCQDGFKEICNNMIGCFDRSCRDLLSENIHFLQGDMFFGHKGEEEQKAFNIDEEFVVKVSFELRMEDNQPSTFGIIFPSGLVNQFFETDVAWGDIELDKHGKPRSGDDDADAQPQNSPIDNANTRILIVDDYLLLRHTLKRVLKSHGFQVMEADNGEAGMNKAQRSVPDLIIIDNFSPPSDGIELIMRMRDLKALSTVPIIIWSSTTNEKHYHRSMLAGASDYMVKSNNYREIVRKIEYHLALRDKIASATVQDPS